MKMQSTICATILVLAGLAATNPVVGQFMKKSYAVPTDERIQTVRQQFLSAKRPLAYLYVVDVPRDTVWYDNSCDHIELKGEASKLCEGATTAELIYALWGYLDDPNYDADACIVLLGHLKTSLGGGDGGKPTYVSTANQGNWMRQREFKIPECKRACREALHEYASSWYPHKVLFDEYEVRTVSATNAEARAKYIAEMQRALSDPNTLAHNPLEVENIFYFLSYLNAKEAVTNLVECMFYDWNTGGDYRIPTGYRKGDDLGRMVEPCTWLVPAFGDQYIPLVLDRVSKATPHERSTQIGGGATPVLAMLYFIGLGYTEDKAIKAIEDFKKLRKDLTSNQVSALDEIIEVIKTKQYRPTYIRKSTKPSQLDWVPPVATTNAASK